MKKSQIVFSIFLIIYFMFFPIKNEFVECKESFKQEYSIYKGKLWNNTVKEYLNSPLWIDNYIYDAGHFLMIPLHSAFNSGNREWTAQFIEFINRFIFAYTNGEVSEKRLDRLQFFYLLSQYLVKAEKENINIPKILPVILYKEVKKYWLEEPAWQWDDEDFSNGIKERVLWKLKAKDCKKSFYKAIIDEELFLFAIASDLITYSKLSNNQFGSLELLNDIYNTTNAVFRQRVKWNNLGGWVFQPGVWRDHGNYKYVGKSKKEIGISEMKIDNIAPDSSHGTRFPLWLTSLYEAGSLKSEKVFYENLKEGLEIQFFSKVLIPPDNAFPAYRTTNYMDGCNGIYRWDYKTCPGNGYGPYELSGTLLLGWWSFFGSEKIQAVYKEITNQFPLSKEVIKLYTGPNTVRGRHSLVEKPRIYNNGFIELINILASKYIF